MDQEKMLQFREMIARNENAVNDIRHQIDDMKASLELLDQVAPSVCYDNVVCKLIEDAQSNIYGAMQYVMGIMTSNMPEQAQIDAETGEDVDIEVNDAPQTIDSASDADDGAFEHDEPIYTDGNVIEAPVASESVDFAANELNKDGYEDCLTQETMSVDDDDDEYYNDGSDLA